MRTIYADKEPVRVETGCGLRPLHLCPVQVWANQNGIIHTKTWFVLWAPKIFLWTKDDSSKKIANQVQNLCDSCSYGEAFKIKNQRGSR